MKKQLTAVLLVALMALSLVSVVSVTTATAAPPAAQTQTTLTVSKLNPYCNEQVTFTAQVNALTKGKNPTWAALTTSKNKPITVTIYHFRVAQDGSTQQVNDYSAQTTTGSITWTTSWSTYGSASGTTAPYDQRTYYAVFAGASGYATSTSTSASIYVQKIPTKLSLTMTYQPSNGMVYQLTMQGALTDSAGNGIAGKVIQFGLDDGSPITDSYGVIKAITQQPNGVYNTGTRTLNPPLAAIEVYNAAALFAGDNTYGSSVGVHT